ncbi:S26 family signal peptidase [Sulfidibacter corallicola]|uniref:S26 family signal peptidase n=1 Tax=Sulfidibacter corallicola TaxID=2818388 RepID=UPI003B20ECA1
MFRRNRASVPIHNLWEWCIRCSNLLGLKFYRVRGHNMPPILRDDQLVCAQKISNHSAPQKASIVISTHRVYGQFLKRIVAKNGDTVLIGGDGKLSRALCDMGLIVRSAITARCLFHSGITMIFSKPSPTIKRQKTRGRIAPGHGFTICGLRHGRPDVTPTRRDLADDGFDRHMTTLGQVDLVSDAVEDAER